MIKYLVAGVLILGAIAAMAAVACADPDMDAAIAKLNEAIAHLDEYERLDNERARNDLEYQRLQREAANAARDVAVYVDTQRDNEQAVAGIGAGLASILGLGGLGTLGVGGTALYRFAQSKQMRNLQRGEMPGVTVNVDADAGPSASGRFRNPGKPL